MCSDMRSSVWARDVTSVSTTVTPIESMASAAAFSRSSVCSNVDATAMSAASAARWATVSATVPSWASTRSVSDAMFRSTAPLNAIVSADIRSSIVSRRSLHLLGRVALHQFPERLRIRTGQLRQPHDARLDQAFHRDLVLLARPPLDAHAFGEHLDLLRGLARLVRDRGADLLGQRLVVGGERRRMLLDPLGQPAHGLRAALHVALHRLDDPGGLTSDEVAVLHDPLLDRAGEVLVALVEVRERRGDVRLDLLELRTDHLDALERRRVRDLVDRVRRQLDRLTDQAAVLGELRERILEPRRAKRQRLEPIVARRDQAPDRLIAGDEAEDALLLG